MKRRAVHKTVWMVPRISRAVFNQAEQCSINLSSSTDKISGNEDGPTQSKLLSKSGSAYSNSLSVRIGVLSSRVTESSSSVFVHSSSSNISQPTLHQISLILLKTSQQVQAKWMVRLEICMAKYSYDHWDGSYIPHCAVQGVKRPSAI